MIDRSNSPYFNHYNMPEKVPSKPIKPALPIYSKVKNIQSPQEFLKIHEKTDFEPWHPHLDPNIPGAFNLKQKSNTPSLAKGEGIPDNEGLSTAYGAPNNTYTRGDTLYIAGTQFGKLVSGSLPWNWGNGDFQKGGKDVWDDVSKFPVWGDVKKFYKIPRSRTSFKS